MSRTLDIRSHFGRSKTKGPVAIGLTSFCVAVQLNQLFCHKPRDGGGRQQARVHTLRYSVTVRRFDIIGLLGS